jgi:Trk K+ transport system NAD-binding subunit
MAAPGAGAVLVCGLGALGVECVLVLQRYGVTVRAIDLADARCPDGITFVRGDCRQPEVLRRAGIETCRGVVLVTGDARANVEAALATRKLSPTIHIVARAGQDNINEMLSTLLGNFVAYEPGRLAAGALALAASNGETIGYFRVEGRRVRILRRRVLAGDHWQGSAVRQVERQGHFVLEHDTSAAAADPVAMASPGVPSPHRLFHRYDPERAIEEGDTLTLLAVDAEVIQVASARREPERRAALADWLTALPSSLGRPAGVVLASFAAIAAALTVSAIAFPAGERSLSTLDGIFTALVLMTGGTYADLFPPFNHLSNGLRLLSITLSATGTVFVGLLYAWLTGRIMALRLSLGPRRPPQPRRDHVVIVGLGRVGRQATVLLQQLDHALTGIELDGLDDHSLPLLSVIKGNGTEVAALAAAHIAGARAVLATTPDEWVNLEIALQVRRLNPDCELVIRTGDVRFSRNIADVVPRLRALCEASSAAKA